MWVHCNPLQLGIFYVCVSLCLLWIFVIALHDYSHQWWTESTGVRVSILFGITYLAYFVWYLRVAGHAQHLCTLLPPRIQEFWMNEYLAIVWFVLLIQSVSQLDHCPHVKLLFEETNFIFVSYKQNSNLSSLDPWCLGHSSLCLHFGTLCLKIVLYQSWTL
jgi:hypothetical protein